MKSSSNWKSVVVCQPKISKKIVKLTVLEQLIHKKKTCYLRRTLNTTEHKTYFWKKDFMWKTWGNSGFEIALISTIIKPKNKIKLTQCDK